MFSSSSLLPKSFQDISRKPYSVILSAQLLDGFKGVHQALPPTPAILKSLGKSCAIMLLFSGKHVICFTGL